MSEKNDDVAGTEAEENLAQDQDQDAKPKLRREDRRSGFAPVKPEFIIHDHKPKLQTEFLSADVKQELLSKDEAAVDKVASEEQQAEEDLEPPQKKVKLTGRNKKRPRNEKIQAKDRICPAIKSGKECKFGERCKFNHNIEEFLEQKMPDLDRPCLLFETFGFCKYGVACRFAKSHLNEKNENVINQELYEKMGSKMGPLNTLKEEVRHKLWKRRYNFKKADTVVKEVQKTFRGIDIHAESKEEDGLVVKVETESETTTDVDAAVKTENGSGSTPIAPSNMHVETVNQKTSLGSASGVEDAVKMENNVKTFGPITDEEVTSLRPGERKKVDFRNKLYLAPLTTVGNLPFRRLCKGFGVDITCGEMAVASQLLKGKQSEWSLIKRHPCEDVFGVQLCGSYPDSMTRCAQLLVESSDVDFIDINCGCPIDLIFKKGCGCALMGKATKLEQISRSMLGVMGDTPLTVKIRTGILDHKNVAHTLIPRLRDAGVSLMTLHGRSREQRYTRLADWDYISQCSAAGSPMPVFGNGDVLSYEDANYHMEKNNVSGVMIARGALMKPWIFTEIKEQRHWDISSGERFDMLRNFTNYGLEHWGSDHQGVETTRRFLLEWLSFLHRYIPVGILEQVPQKINERPPYYVGRNDLETLMASTNCADWLKISEMLLGPVPDSFQFLPKHKANAYR